MVKAISDAAAAFKSAVAAGKAAGSAESAPTETPAGKTESFGNLFRALKQLGRKDGAADPRLTGQVAAQMVSELFLAPLLAEMREFPFGRELATGGLTESAFGQQFDQRVGDLVAAHSPGVLSAVTRYLKPRALTASGGEVSSEAK